MTSSFIYRLFNIRSNFLRIPRQEKYFYYRMKKDQSRKHHSTIPTREDKYGELKSRLASIPISDLLQEGFDSFRNDLCHDSDERLSDFLNWCLKVFDYNARILILLDSEIFLKAHCAYGFIMTDKCWNKWDSDSWRSAVRLSWCLESFGSCFSIIDDIVDQSLIRRGELCWYRKDQVGLTAINDSQVIQWSIFKLLRKYFSHSKCYMNVIHEFLQANLEASYGQIMDTNHQINPLHKFTFKKYRTMTEYKAGNPVFRLPIHLAMHLNDRYDYISPFEYSGLLGNDIRFGKLTWFSAKFLDEAPETMKKKFLENYGVDDNEAVEIVLELYGKFNMSERFQEFEDTICREISTLIESKNDSKLAVFYDILHQMQRRKKL